MKYRRYCLTVLVAAGLGLLAQAEGTEKAMKDLFIEQGTEDEVRAVAQALVSDWGAQTMLQIESLSGGLTNLHWRVTATKHCGDAHSLPVLGRPPNRFSSRHRCHQHRLEHRHSQALIDQGVERVVVTDTIESSVGSLEIVDVINMGSLLASQIRDMCDENPSSDQQPCINRT